MLLISLLIYFTYFIEFLVAKDFFLEINSESENEVRLFHKDEAYKNQKNTYSTTLKTELFVDFQKNLNLVVEPIYRYDLYDKNRSQLDLAQGYLIHYKDKFEIKLGISKVFWGITESKNLVDIINMHDLTNGKPKTKLGQPMVNYSIISDKYGYFDYYYMPLFIKSSEIGSKGRLRLPLPKERDDNYLEGGVGKKQPSWAFKWEKNYNYYDFSVQFFRGNGRISSTISKIDSNGLKYYSGYERITQLGTFIQRTYGPLILKFEGIRRNGQRNAKSIRKNYFSSVFGLEYVITRAFNKVWDFNMYIEYSNDERNNDSNDYLQNDLFSGAKIYFNDTSGTELTLSKTTDMDGGGNTGLIDISTRLTDDTRLTLEYNAYWAVNLKDSLYSFRRDNYFGFNLKKYF